MRCKYIVQKATVSVLIFTSYVTLLVECNSVRALSTHDPGNTASGLHPLRGHLHLRSERSAPSHHSNFTRPYLEGYFATYADIPVYDDEVRSCDKTELSSLYSGMTNQCQSALVGSTRLRRNQVSNLIQLCDCLSGTPGANLNCSAGFGGTDDETVAALSIAQFADWCSVQPYAYSNVTDQYGFSITALTNGVVLTKNGDGTVNISAEVLLPLAPRNSTFIAVGFTGDCQNASLPYRAVANGGRVQLSLNCQAGGVCFGSKMLQFVPQVGSLNSLVILDSHVMITSMLGVAPKFLCASLLPPPYENLEVGDDINQAHDDHDPSSSTHGTHRGPILGLIASATAVIAIGTVWRARILSRRAVETLHDAIVDGGFEEDTAIDSLSMSLLHGQRPEPVLE